MGKITLLLKDEGFSKRRLLKFLKVLAKLKNKMYYINNQYIQNIPNSQNINEGKMKKLKCVRLQKSTKRRST